MQNIIQSVHSEVFALREYDLKVSGKLYVKAGTMSTNELIDWNFFILVQLQRDTSWSNYLYKSHQEKGLQNSLRAVDRVSAYPI